MWCRAVIGIIRTYVIAMINVGVGVVGVRVGDINVIQALG